MLCKSLMGFASPWAALGYCSIFGLLNHDHKTEENGEHGWFSQIVTAAWGVRGSCVCSPSTRAALPQSGDHEHRTRCRVFLAADAKERISARVPRKEPPWAQRPRSAPSAPGVPTVTDRPPVEQNELLVSQNYQGLDLPPPSPFPLNSRLQKHAIVTPRAAEGTQRGGSRSLFFTTLLLCFLLTTQWAIAATKASLLPACN